MASPKKTRNLPAIPTIKDITSPVNAEQLPIWATDKIPELCELKLNDREVLYCIHYVLNGGKGCEAVRSACFNVINATQKNKRLQQNENIKRAITILTEAKVNRDAGAGVADLGIETVINGFREVLSRCLQAKPVMYWDVDTKSYTQEIDSKTGLGVWKFDAAGANKALENLGKYLGMFKENLKVEHTGLAELIVEARKRL